MHKLSRSLFVGVLAMGALVACDNVDPTPPAPQVISVTVVPASVQLAVGQTASLAATVIGDAGLTDRTVTWSSSNSAIATVDANGVVRAVAAGQTTILATSRADVNVRGAASVVVTPIIAPAISIASITKNGLPIDITNVAGQVDVTLNIAPNGAPVNSVDLLVQCPNNTAPVLVQRQTFSGANAPAGPVTLSFNTAQLNATGSAAQFQNGACNIIARLVTPAGSPEARDQVFPATFNNQDTVIATVSTERTGADQINREWKGGAVTVRVVPVLYSNPATAPKQIDVTLAGPLTTGGNVSFTRTATGPFPATVVFPMTGTGNIDNITVEPATITANVIGTNDVAIPTTPLNVAIRLDNQDPTAGAYAFNTQGTANNWIGTAFAFNSAAGNGYTAGVTPQGLNDWGGVDRVTVTFEAAPINTNTQACTSAQTGLTFTAVTSGSNLQSSQVNGISPNGPSYCLRMVERDALTNATTTFAGVFGADREAPRLIVAGGVANNSSFDINAVDEITTDAFPVAGTAAAAPGMTYNFTLRDTLSGFDGTPVNYTITRLFPGLSGAGTCVVGTFATSTGCSPTDGPQTVVVDSTDRTSQISVTGGTANQGYFTFNGTVRDQAANSGASALPTRVVLVDAAVPVVSRTGVTTVGVIPGNSTAVFNFDATDNVELYLASAALAYPSATIRSANQQIGTPFDATLTSSVTNQNVSFANFFRSLTADPTVAGTKPTSVTVRAVDAATNEGSGTARAIPPEDVQNSNITTFSQASVGLQSFQIISAQSGTVALTCTEGANCVVTVRVQGPTGTFENPFVAGGVNLYQVNAAGELELLQQQTAGAQTDNGVNRFYTYTFTVPTPASAAAQFNPWNLRAIGFTGGAQGGDALLSNQVAVATPAP